MNLLLDVASSRRRELKHKAVNTHFCDVSRLLTEA